MERTFKLITLDSIDSGSPTKLNVTKNGNDLLLSFTIKVKGFDDPTGAADPDNNRKLVLSDPLYLGDIEVTLDAASGIDESKLNITATIDTKIPGTTGEAVRKKRKSKPKIKKRTATKPKSKRKK